MDCKFIYGFLTLHWHPMPLGVGQGQNVGLRDFAIFRLCCRRGHPCFTNTCLVLSFTLSWLIDLVDLYWIVAFAFDLNLDLSCSRSHSILVRDSLPLYPLFISSVCGLWSERFDSWKSEKSTTPPGIVPHSVPAAWNSIKEIFRPKIKLSLFPQTRPTRENRPDSNNFFAIFFEELFFPDFSVQPLLVCSFTMKCHMNAFFIGVQLVTWCADKCDLS